MLYFWRPRQGSATHCRVAVSFNFGLASPTHNLTTPHAAERRASQSLNRYVPCGLAGAYYEVTKVRRDSFHASFYNTEGKGHTTWETQGINKYAWDEGFRVNGWVGAMGNGLEIAIKKAKKK